MRCPHRWWLVGLGGVAFGESISPGPGFESSKTQAIYSLVFLFMLVIKDVSPYLSARTVYFCSSIIDSDPLEQKPK